MLAQPGDNEGDRSGDADAGIDWAKDDDAVCVVVAQGEALLSVAVEESPY